MTDSAAVARLGRQGTDAAMRPEASTAEAIDRMNEQTGRLCYEMVSPLESYFPLAFIESVAGRVALVVMVCVLIALVFVRRRDLAALMTDGELPSETGSITRMREETTLSPLRRASLSVVGMATMFGLLYLELTAAVAAVTLLSTGLGYH